MDSLMEKAPSIEPSPQDVLPPALAVRRLQRAAVPIVLCAVVGAACGYLYAGTLEKSYTAGGIVAVEGDRIAIPELQGALRNEATPDPMPLVHTEVLALSARDLVAQVAGQLRLADDPEFNAALRKPGPLAVLRDRLKAMLPGAQQVRGEKQASSAEAAQDALVNAAEHNLVISQDNRSLVIGVAFSAHDPVLAAAFVNTLVADYIDGRAQRRTSVNAGANVVVSQRIEQVRADIARIEDQMRDLRLKSGVVSLRAGSVGQQQVEALTTAASQATLERGQIEANWQRASALSQGGSSEALASVLGSETISRLREQEEQSAAKVADLQERYGSAYPALQSAQANLAAARREIAGEAHRIVASLATQLKVARAHEADVLTQLAAARHEGVASQNVQAQLEQLQQDAATRRDLYRTLLERAQQTETQPGSTATPDVRVLSKASVPGQPSAPNKKLAGLFGGVGGGLLACVAALAFTRKIAPAGAAAFARANGLSVVAAFTGRAAARDLADRLVHNAGLPEAEGLRVARSRIGQLSRTPPRVLGFVGAQAGAAATSLACAYARTAARDGLRVLLIDQDVADTAMSRLLGAPVGRVAAALSGDAAWQDCVTPDRVPGLDLLVATPSNGEAVRRDTVGLENVLAEARGEYDQIVLGAPAASQADAARVVRSADLSVVVVDDWQVSSTGSSDGCAALARLSRNPLAAMLIVRA